MDVTGQPASQPTASATGSHQPAATLVVDLDGTLLKTDLLWETLLHALRDRPWLAVMVPVWLARGRAVLKAELARRANLDIAALPYREAVVAYVRQQRATGRRIVLATGADRTLAQAVADYLGLFDAVLASDAQCHENLTGERKRAAIEAHESGRAIEYLGDHAKDLAIWQRAATAHLAGTPRVHGKLEQLIQSRANDETPLMMGQHFPTPPCSPATVLRAMRVHQWVKSLLLLVPLVLAHQLDQSAQVGLAVLAALLFSLVASSVYLVNDLLDLEADRRHHDKQRRAIASGALPVPVALVLAPSLLGLATAISAVALPWAFTGMLGLYFALALIYTIWLKQHMVVDVLVLAGLYAYRVLIGAVAIDVYVSPWLLAFSMFFFLSLAFVKRYADLDRIKDEPDATMHGRGYQVRDLELFRSIGPTVGYLSVLVLAMYISSDRVLEYYAAYPKALWLICPLLLYWITRIWFITARGDMTDDPIVFTLKDPISYVVGGLIFVIAAAASGPGGLAIWA